MSTAAIASRVDTSASQPVTAASTRSIVVLSHCEDGVWWAESPTIPGFYASADSRDDLIDEVLQLLEFSTDYLPGADLAAAVRSGHFAIAIAEAGSPHLVLGM